MAGVLLIGMGQTALSALDSLSEQFNMLGIVRAANSHDNGVDPVIHRAQQLRIPVFSDASPDAIKTLLSTLNPDCVVVSSYKRLLPSALISKYPFINVHYSPLPRYRGQSQVNWAVINDEPCAAITIHRIVDEMDAGNILFQHSVPIGDKDTVTDILEQLNALQRRHLGDTIGRFLNGYPGVPQDPENATYGCCRIPADGEIDWTSSTRDISCLVRGLTPPYPGAYTYFQGRRLIVWRAEPADNPPNYVGRIPGRIIAVSPTTGHVDVLTGDGVLRVFEVQIEGDQRTVAAAVIKSIRATLGLRTGELLERIQALERRLDILLEAQFPTSHRNK